MKMKRIQNFEQFNLNEKMGLIDYEDYAKLVVEAYNAAPDFDPKATKHWDALLNSSENWYKKMMSDIKIIMVDTEQYESAEQMAVRVKKEKVMYVTKEYKDHRYWTDEQYQCFRAVHDYIVHVEGGSNFTLRGEMKATNLHMKIIPELAKPALFMEIPGNVCNKIVTDKFPEQIKIAVLDQFDYNNIGLVKGYTIKNKKLIKK